VGHCRQFENVRSWSPSGWYRHLRRLIITGELARRALLNRKVWISLKSEHAVRRNLRLLSALDIPLPPAERPPLLPVAENSASVSRAFEGFEPAKKKVALHLGPPNNQYHKIWAPERFGRLCCALARLCPVEILAVGTSDELDSVETARAEYPALRSWVGKSSLLETFAIIKRCDLFISNDTGMAKAAMALGVPTITLMGLSDPEEVGIIWDKDKHLEIRTGISCSPCARLGMAKFGGLNYLNCGHHDCLQKLEVDFALGAIRKKYGYNLEEIPHA
jgi:ADP-heptose:LPS heptosyltransferase